MFFREDPEKGLVELRGEGGEGKKGDRTMQGFSSHLSGTMSFSVH